MSLKSLAFSIALVAIGALYGATAIAQDLDGLGLYAVGGSLDYVKPSDIDGALGFGLRADIGALTRDIILFPEIHYWSKSTERDDYFKQSVKTRELSIGVNAHYYLNPEDVTNWYFGAGLGLYNSKVTSESEVLGQTYDLDSSSSLGLVVMGGAERPFGNNARAFGELRYKVDGTIDYLSIVAGITMELR